MKTFGGQGIAYMLPGRSLVIQVRQILLLMYNPIRSLTHGPDLKVAQRTIRTQVTASETLRD